MTRLSNLALILAASATATAAAQAGGPDPHSWSRPDQVAIEKLNLDLEVDFERQELRGTAVLRLDHRSPSDRLWLDSWDLRIDGVWVDGEATTFELSPVSPFLGQGLSIPIDSDAEEVRIEYASAPDAAALLWLSPAQTSGQRHPFLFSQSQSVYARSWMPIQDSPGVRFPYEATLRVPEGLMALMSAGNPTEPSPDGVYHFSMQQPVPAYLIALAVGELEFRAFDERSGVYAEPERIDAAAYEFAETPEMIVATERLYGPYAWGRYDLLVLPPYFPFGGMENPRLSFITPTVLAGDRSLVSLIAHELAHSWSGNLVTNSTWEHFWLNEGFTVYLERRVMEELYGAEYAGMLERIGYGDLRDDMDSIGPDSYDTALKLDLVGRNPEDCFTDVAYEKGYFLLRLIEEAVGRERFDAFLRDYFHDFAFGTIDTESWVEFLRAELLDDERYAALDVAGWLYHPGLPQSLPRPRDDAFAPVREAAAGLAEGSLPTVAATEGWTSHHWVEFLRSVPAAVDVESMGELDRRFHFTQTGNSEVLQEWLLRSIERWYEPALPRLEEFLYGMGRRKFLRPLYAALMESEAGQELAKRVYERARPRYHPLATRSLDLMLGAGR